MKNIFRLGIFALALSLCIGSSALAFKEAKGPTRVEAAGEALQTWQS